MLWVNSKSVCCVARQRQYWSGSHSLEGLPERRERLSNDSDFEQKRGGTSADYIWSKALKYCYFMYIIPIP